MNDWGESLLGWCLAALLLFWFVGAHNRLVRLRAAAVQAYGALDALIARQIDYVQAQPDPDEPPGDGRALQGANLQLLAVLGATRAHPLDPAAMAALTTALHVLLAAWARMHPDRVLAFESDGTLSRPASLSTAGEPGAMAGAVAMPLGWPEPTALIEITRAQFNTAVAQYNRAIAQFPALLLAWIFRWRRAAPLL